MTTLGCGPLCLPVLQPAAVKQGAPQLTAGAVNTFDAVGNHFGVESFIVYVFTKSI